LEILRSNLYASVSGLTAQQAYALGDINLDGSINRFDFTTFRTAFAAEWGAAALAQLGANIVPEPSTGAMLAGTAMIAALRSYCGLACENSTAN
jgi:hypothetical protein